MLQPLLEQIYNGQSLTQQQATTLFSAVAKGELAPEVLAGALIGLRMKGESAAEIAGAAAAFLEVAEPFPHQLDAVVDIVGTGGDGAHTFNISSTSVFVAAAAGLPVCKHGNRSVSSRSGAADVLTELGINIEMSQQQAQQCLTQCGACFIFAPQYHPAFRHAAPVRKALKTRTLFNILGPLVNPARPTTMLLGVYDPSLLKVMAEALVRLNVPRALVVYGNGLDEISVHGPTQMVEVHGSTLTEHVMTPQELGLQEAPLSALTGGSPADNAAITRNILQGKGTPAQRDAVAANVGAVLYLTNHVPHIREGVQLAHEILASGRAYQILETMKEVSHG